MAENQFSVNVPNPLQALLLGEQSYDSAKQDRQRQEAADLYAKGDTQNALAKLLAAGDTKSLTALGQYQASAQGVYGNPIMLQRPDGSYAVGAIGKNGKPNIIDFGAGMSPTVPSKSIDTGTGTYVVPGRVTGMPGQPQGSPVQIPQAGGGMPTATQPVQGAVPPQGYFPKDVAGAKREGALGAKQGEAAAGLPTAISGANQTIGLINQLLEHPGLDSIVGSIDQYRPAWTMGGQGKDALARWEQLQGKAFGAAFDMLRGGGAITEVEGVKATNAYARMQRYQDEASFKAALKDFRDAVAEGARKLAERAGPAGAQYESRLPQNGASVGMPPGAPQQAPQGAPVRVNSPQERDALPPGAQYIAPDGSLRTKQ